MARFIIRHKVYDTEKMKLVGHVKKSYPIGAIFSRILDFELYRSEKGNFLLTCKNANGDVCGEAIEEYVAKELLIEYDYDSYVALFGELEEA